MSITTNHFFGRWPILALLLLPSVISGQYAVNFIVKDIIRFAFEALMQISTIAWDRPPIPVVAFQACRSA